MAVSAVRLETRLARRFALRHRYLLLLTTLLLSVALPGFAQPNQGNAQAGLPVIESYNARAYNGFPQIWTILEDRRGIMYFGNSGGEILEYDGVTWRKITTANVVRSLAIDDSGKIWVGSGSNFGYLSPDATGKLNFVSLLDKVPAEQRNFGEGQNPTVPKQCAAWRKTFVVLQQKQRCSSYHVDLDPAKLTCVAFLGSLM